jgi:YVTN family beta-propeller protein
VSNANGTDSKFATITVLESIVTVPPVANFSCNVTSGYSPLSVKFTDLSENTTLWNWNFGDGASSTEHNPEHIYSTVGNYTVTLIVNNADGIAAKSAKINVHERANRPYAYITNYFNNTVSIIDTATNEVTETVNVGSKPFGVAVSPDGAYVYIANWGSSNVSVIDAASNKVIASVNVGKRPYGIAVSPDGSKVYVTNEYSNTVSVIDTATNTVAATLPAGSWPSGVAVSPDGTVAYVVNEDGTVSVIDTATNTITATMEVGSNPIAVAVSPDGRKVYVTNYESNTVSIIDTATNTVTATVEVGSHPGGIAANPDGSKVYVTNEFSSNVSIIDTATNAVIATVDVGNSLWGVAVSPDGQKVYVANENSNIVSIIDAATNTVIAAVKVGSGPIAFGKFVGPVLGPVPVCKTSRIYGYCFNDSNKKKNTRKVGLSTMTISLNGYDTCKGRLVSKTTKTNSTGYFEFKGVDPGVYVLSEGFVFGWLPTTDAAYSLTVPKNSASIRKDFGNKKFVK